MKRAFTLIELIVVLVILVIMAAVALPRLGSHDRRTFELAVDQVTDLVTMYAQRDGIAERPAAIWHDTERNWIVLLAMASEGENQDPAEWYPDPYVDPVRLPAMVASDGVTAFLDGDPVDFARWPIATKPGRERDSVEIELRGGSDLVRSVYLPAHAVAPYEPGTGRELEPVDLDAAGRAREDW